MRKIIFMIVGAIFFALSASAQVYSIIKTERQSGETYAIWLNNGDCVTWIPRVLFWGGGWYISGREIQTNITLETKLPKETKVIQNGNYYEFVWPKKIAVKTIKDFKIHRLPNNYKGNVTGSLSYNTFTAWLLNPDASDFERLKGNINGSIQGGERTIINVYFTDGSKVSIDVSDDPLWLDVEKGMKVEVYSLGKAQRIYKLL